MYMIRFAEDCVEDRRYAEARLLKAAFFASRFGHEEEMMRFCWECFRSDTNVKNYLRLFGTKNGRTVWYAGKGGAEKHSNGKFGK